MNIRIKNCNLFFQKQDVTEVGDFTPTKANSLCQFTENVEVGKTVRVRAVLVGDSSVAGITDKHFTVYLKYANGQFQSVDSPFVDDNSFPKIFETVVTTAPVVSAILSADTNIYGKVRLTFVRINE